MDLPECIRRIEVRRFNRWCGVFTLAWLLVTVPFGLHFRPTFQDFPQFYMSGVIARHGAWDALYPEPHAGIDTNPGLAEDSTPHPRYAELRRQYRVPDITRPITPPPSALFFAPLSFLTYRHAYYAWALVLSLCVWGVSLQAGRVYRTLSGAPSHWEGLLGLFLALAPTSARSIRITNTTPLVALCIGFVVLGAIRHDRFRTGLALVIGATMKYATLALVPLLLVSRKWRTLTGAVVFGLALLAVSLLIEGVSPFRQFATKIAPTLNRSHLFPGNQAMPALLGRINPARVNAQPSMIAPLRALRVSQVAFLGVILALILRRPREDWRDPANLCAGAAALLCWLLIFSPITWEHYPIFLAPLGGWLLWEGMASRRRFVWVSVIAVLISLPVSIIHVRGFSTYKLILPEPLNSTQLIAIGAIFVIALGRLRLAPVPRAARDANVAPAPLPSDIESAVPAR